MASVDTLPSLPGAFVGALLRATPTDAMASSSLSILSAAEAAMKGEAGGNGGRKGGGGKGGGKGGGSWRSVWGAKLRRMRQSRDT